MSKTWRDRCRPIIAGVIKENEGKCEREIRRALKVAYPFGIREYHPYKIWCDEIKVQLGKKATGKKNGNNTPNQPKLF